MKLSQFVFIVILLFTLGCEQSPGSGGDGEVVKMSEASEDVLKFISDRSYYLLEKDYSCVSMVGERIYTFKDQLFFKDLNVFHRGNGCNDAISVISFQQMLQSTVLISEDYSEIQWKGNIYKYIEVVPDFPEYIEELSQFPVELSLSQNQKIKLGLYTISVIQIHKPDPIVCVRAPCIQPPELMPFVMIKVTSEGGCGPTADSRCLGLPAFMREFKLSEMQPLINIGNYTVELVALKNSNNALLKIDKVSN